MTCVNRATDSIAGPKELPRQESNSGPGDWHLKCAPNYLTAPTQARKTILKNVEKSIRRTTSDVCSRLPASLLL